MRLSTQVLATSLHDLDNLKDGKTLINTINAYSYVVAQHDSDFQQALSNCDLLLPDGMSIVWAARFLNSPTKPKCRIAGFDLFMYEMQRLAQSTKTHPTVMFLGSTEQTLESIQQLVAKEYPSFHVVTYSPPYEKEFSETSSQRMIDAINKANPNLLWIGMTAPKQEKWTYQHFKEMDVQGPVGCIGAVFDFYAGKVHRAPEWMQHAGLEWLFRLCSEPRRLWRRYLIGNLKFIVLIIKEKKLTNK